MLIAHKIALDLNNVQATYMARASGTARFAYNWALSEWSRQYEAWKSHRKWLYAGKSTHLNVNSFLGCLKLPNAPHNWRLFSLGRHSKIFLLVAPVILNSAKKGVHDRFSLSNDQFSIDGSRIPNPGWVRMREVLRFTGKIISATISRVADRWFVSITVDVPDSSHLPEAENQGVVGIDLGVSALATLSTGEPPVVGPKAHKKLLGRLRRLSRSLSRKQKGSANRNKAKQKLARLHARIANIRSDAMHKLTSDVTRRFHTVGIEDLNVRGMVRNRHLARSISDMSFFEFRRQLEYKAGMRGGLVIVANRFYPSSKICSDCGYKLGKLPLSLRYWKCPSCGEEHDRDENAAINLKNYAVSSTVSACGEEGSGSGRKTRVKPSSVKQEVSCRFD